MTKTKALNAYISYLADTVTEQQTRAKISAIVRDWETYKITNNECMKRLEEEIRR